jgi:hypothetical protein
MPPACTGRCSVCCGGRRGGLPALVRGRPSAAQVTAPAQNRLTPLRQRDIRVVDGDTIDAVVQPSTERRRFRITGFTPETYYAKCDAEHTLGYTAARRLEELVGVGEFQLDFEEGARDRYTRAWRRFRFRGEDVERSSFEGSGRRLQWPRQECRLVREVGRQMTCRFGGRWRRACPGVLQTFARARSSDNPGSYPQGC